MNTPLFDFRPFHAWRYGTPPGELARVIAPPYDVISPEEQEALYRRSPHNVIRLILGKEADFYEHARQCWEEWTQTGILVQDKRPAFYLYEQVFHHPRDSRSLSRLALVGILKLESSESVLPHEQTFRAPKKDRLLLLEKTRTNLSPVFGLYKDSNTRLSRVFSPYRKRPALFQARDPQGTLHRGWAIESGAGQRAIHQALAREKILIADGHHRFETALEYRNQMRKAFPKTPPEAPFDFVMMALVAFEDEGLLVLPTHRVISSLGSLQRKEFLNRLRVHFDFVPHSEEKLYSELEKQPEKEKVFGGLFGKEGSFLLRLKDSAVTRKLLPAGKPPVWYELEGNLLTHLIFEKLWGISEVKRRGFVSHTHSWEEAAEALGEGGAEAAFLMRAVKLDTIQQWADTGQRMSQKTTYFYPKLASGLFFYHHEPR